MILSAAVAAVATQPAVGSAAHGTSDITPILGLVGRRVPRLAPFLELILLPAGEEAGTETKEYFTVGNASGCELNITVTANSVSALALGVHYYLKYIALRHVSWGVSNLNTISVPPPRPATAVHETVGARWRYAWNVCTHGYSMPWWDWGRWELELDFMSLQGVNLPLLFTGQEYILTQVFTEQFNLTAPDLDPFFSGPAFLPWQRMGNQAGWGGPLSPAYRLQAHRLQVKILQRAISLGMTPVLPCFGGNVPSALHKRFPNATLNPFPPWNNFPNESMLLDPTDPLFVTIGASFAAAQQRIYKAAGAWPADGRAPMFNCDVWMNDRHNWEPASTTAQYLSAAGAAMVEQLAPVDGAVWLNQGGWMFHYPWWQTNGGERVYHYLSRVPPEKVLILELAAERGPTVFDMSYTPDGSPYQSNYWGRPWVWCLLFNYGQAPGMYGNLSFVATEPRASFALPNATTRGVGIAPEGIMNNPVVFELMFETAWRRTAGARLDIAGWLRDYALRRYGGREDTNTQAAWLELGESVYSTAIHIPAADLDHPPSVSLQSKASGAPGRGLGRAWSKLVAAASSSDVGALSNGPLLQDVVDVGRGALADFFNQARALFAGEWHRAGQTSSPDSVHAASVLGNALLSCLRALDELLGTNDAFLLGRWIVAARAAATSPQERALFEFGARNQLMVWGPTPEIGPNADYARKHWQGLVGVYYHERWRLFLGIANATLAAGRSELPTALVSSTLDAWARNFSHQSIAGGQSGILLNSTGPARTLSLSRQLLATYNDEGGNALGRYQRLVGRDIPQLNYTLNVGAELVADLGRMAVLCELHPRCVAFNSNGWLKSTADRTKTRVQPKADLYVRVALTT